MSQIDPSRQVSIDAARTRLPAFREGLNIKKHIKKTSICEVFVDYLPGMGTLYIPGMGSLYIPGMGFFSEQPHLTLHTANIHFVGLLVRPS